MIYIVPSAICNLVSQHAAYKARFDKVSYLIFPIYTMIYVSRYYMAVPNFVDTQYKLCIPRPCNKHVENISQMSQVPKKTILLYRYHGVFSQNNADILGYSEILGNNFSLFCFLNVLSIAMQRRFRFRGEQARMALLGCSSTTSSAKLTALLRDMARHFKTEPSETVALCFGYPKTPCLRAN
jgi:hypothetical protein